MPRLIALSVRQITSTTVGPGVQFLFFSHFVKTGVTLALCNTKGSLACSGDLLNNIAIGTPSCELHSANTQGDEPSRAGGLVYI